MNRCAGRGEPSNIFRYSTVTWVIGLIAKHSPGNVRTKDTTNPSFYMSCKVIFIFSSLVMNILFSSCSNKVLFVWENNCICLGGKTDFFEEWKIKYGTKNNFNLTNNPLDYLRKKDMFVTCFARDQHVFFFLR